MPRISEMTDTVFDGVTHPYVPPETLRISDKLTLHRDWDRDIDPVTYEVVRHSLWNINEEHGATIQRISGSPVAIYALDLNPSILTEDGEFRTFQYVHAYGLPAARRFRAAMDRLFGSSTRSQPVLRNVPPAYVLTYKP